MGNTTKQRETSFSFIDDSEVLEVKENELILTDSCKLPIVKWNEIQGNPFRVKPTLRNLQNDDVWVRMPTTLKGERRQVRGKRNHDKKDYAINYGKEYLKAYVISSLIIPLTSLDGVRNPLYDPDSVPEIFLSLIDETFEYLSIQVQKHGIETYKARLPKFWE